MCKFPWSNFSNPRATKMHKTHALEKKIKTKKKKKNAVTKGEFDMFLLRQLAACALVVFMLDVIYFMFFYSFYSALTRHHQ